MTNEARIVRVQTYTTTAGNTYGEVVARNGRTLWTGSPRPRGFDSAAADQAGATSSAGLVVRRCGLPPSAFMT